MYAYAYVYSYEQHGVPIPKANERRKRHIASEPETPRRQNFLIILPLKSLFTRGLNSAFRRYRTPEYFSGDFIPSHGSRTTMGTRQNIWRAIRKFESTGCGFRWKWLAQKARATLEDWSESRCDAGTCDFSFRVRGSFRWIGFPGSLGALMLRLSTSPLPQLLFPLNFAPIPAFQVVLSSRSTFRASCSYGGPIVYTPIDLLCLKSDEKSVEPNSH